MGRRKPMRSGLAAVLQARGCVSLLSGGQELPRPGFAFHRRRIAQMFALAQGGRDARFWGLGRSDPWDSKALGAGRWRPRDDVLEQSEGLAAVELIHGRQLQAEFRGWILEGAPGLAAQDAQDGLARSEQDSRAGRPGYWPSRWRPWRACSWRHVGADQPLAVLSGLQIAVAPGRAAAFITREDSTAAWA